MPQDADDVMCVNAGGGRRRATDTAIAIVQRVPQPAKGEHGGGTWADRPQACGVRGSCVTHEFQGAPPVRKWSRRLFFSDLVPLSCSGLSLLLLYQA